MTARGDTSNIMATQTPTHESPTAARTIRDRIARAGERLWRLEDFGDLPPAAATQTLSRLTREGELERLQKGVYYRPRQTRFGKSRPNPAALQALALARHKVFPAGLSAANLLGFSTQNPAAAELSTTATSLPAKLLGSGVKLITRRPKSWDRLTAEDGALLDFLRRGGELSELSPEATARRVLKLIDEDGRFERLLKAAPTEPPRVRAMLGAIGEELKADLKALDRLRSGLNPLSRYDFGQLSKLSRARNWQAKERRLDETL